MLSTLRPRYRVDRTGGAIVAGLAMLVLAGPGVASPAIRLDFQKPTYTIRGGESFSVDVTIDGDANTTALLDPVVNGLFSYGLKVTFSPGKANPTGATAVAALDFNGFVQQAQYEPQSGYPALRGNIDLSAMVPYAGTQIATFHFTDLSLIRGSYVLNLAIWDFALTDDEFVDGVGTPLDESIIQPLGSTLIVVAEPGPTLSEWGVVLLALGLLTGGVILIRARAPRRGRA